MPLLQVLALHLSGTLCGILEMRLGNGCLIDKRGKNLSWSSYPPQWSRVDLYCINSSALLGCAFFSAEILQTPISWIREGPGQERKMSQHRLGQNAGTWHSAKLLDHLTVNHLSNDKDKRHGLEDVHYFTGNVDCGLRTFKWNVFCLDIFLEKNSFAISLINFFITIKN